MEDTIPKYINDFLEYLEIEKGSSKLTIRDYRHYLEVFKDWHTTTLPGKSLSDLDLQTVRKYRVFLANRIDDKAERSTGYAKITTSSRFVLCFVFLSKMISKHSSLQKLIFPGLKVEA